MCRRAEWVETKALVQKHTSEQKTLNTDVDTRLRLEERTRTQEVREVTGTLRRLSDSVTSLEAHRHPS